MNGPYLWEAGYLDEALKGAKNLWEIYGSHSLFFEIHQSLLPEKDFFDSNKRLYEREDLHLFSEETLGTVWSITIMRYPEALSRPDFCERRSMLWNIIKALTKKEAFDRIIAYAPALPVLPRTTFLLVKATWTLLKKGRAFS